LLFPIVRSK